MDIFFQDFGSELLGEFGEVAVAGNLQRFFQRHITMHIQIGDLITVIVVDASCAVHFITIGVILCLDGCGRRDQLKGRARSECGRDEAVDIRTFRNLVRRIIRIIGRGADHADQFTCLVIVHAYSAFAAVKGFIGSGADIRVQSEGDILAVIIECVDAVDKIKSDQPVKEDPVGAGSDVVVLVSGDMHAGCPDVRVVIEDHAVSSIAHEESSVPVIEGAFGKGAFREDVTVALIDCPFASVMPVFIDKIAKACQKDEPQEEAHQSTFFNFFHRLPPFPLSLNIPLFPNMSSRVRGPSSSGASGFGFAGGLNLPKKSSSLTSLYCTALGV